MANEERRQDYPKILDSITEIKVDIAKVVTLVEERNCSALVWRAEVCKKFEGINKYCQSRQSSKVKTWIGIGLAFTIPMLTFAVTWGETRRQVDVDKDKLVKMEAQIERLQLK